MGGIGISLGVGAGGGGGGAGIAAPPAIDPAATGAVVQLRTSIKGTLTWSKLSGASTIAISAAGLLSLSAALGAGGSATAIARVQNTKGDAVERSITLRAKVAAPTPTPTPTPTPSPMPTGTPIAIPVGFALSQLPYAIYRTGSGTDSTFTTDYSHAAKRPATASTIYVSPTGTANAAGTQADPVPSIAMAIAMGNATNAPYAIEVAAGEYRASTGYTRTAAPAGTYVAAWYNAAPTQHCAIYCPAGRAISSLATALTFSATSDPNIYKATAANSLNRWIQDRSVLDADGVGVGLDQVRTVADQTNPIAEINAAWNAGRGAAYYRSSTKEIWVRLPDNRAPDANVVGYRDYSSTAGLVAAPASGRTIWMENLSFFGGRTAFIVTAAENIAVNIYGRGMVYAFSGADSSPANDGNGSFGFSGGPGEVIHQSSTASYGAQDGFNYHGLSGTSSRAQCPTAHEIGCTSSSAGWNGALTHNGSTIHEASVAVRVGGTYRTNADRTIHDINRAQSWNLGCSVTPRRGQDGSDQSAGYAVGHATDGLTTGMWLDACTVSGNPQFPIEVYPGSILRYANLTFVPVAAKGGSVEAYAA